MILILLVIAIISPLKEYNSLYLELVEILLPEIKQAEVDELYENTKRST